MAEEARHLVAVARQLKNPQKEAAASQAPPPKNRIPALHQKQVLDQPNPLLKNPVADHQKNPQPPNPLAVKNPAERKRRKSDFSNKLQDSLGLLKQTKSTRRNYEKKHFLPLATWLASDLP